MTNDFPIPLVSTDWLFNNLSKVKVLDASWHMPATGRSGKDEYPDRHINGAVYFDIDEIADKATNLPHMMPSREIFAQKISELGISNDDFIVVYDSSGIFSAPRVWWMFRHMGHDKVAVLDGGLKKWLAENKPIANNPKPLALGNFQANPKPDLIRNSSDILENVDTKSAQIIDARSNSRFTGEEKEPRAGLKSGHIVGSCNVHYAALLNQDGTIKDDVTISKVFTNAGIDLDKPIITSCGSGVTACILAIALAKIGKWDVPIYDGSWTEWGQLENAPIESI